MAQPTLKVDYKKLEMPRELDECIMERLVKDSVRETRLVGIKRARKVQEALFLCNIANADKDLCFRLKVLI